MLSEETPKGAILDVSGLLRKEMTPDEAGDALLGTMFRSANGRLTSAEALGHRKFVLTCLYQSAQPKQSLGYPAALLAAVYPSGVYFIDGFG